MVGQKLLKAGKLDVKNPAASSFAKGWRLPPWKTRNVELYLTEDGVAELQIYEHKERHLVDTYRLHDITDVTMVASKTHAHAFEIISGGRSVLILSGTTELASREWIWTLRKLFWPQAIPQECNKELHVQLFPNADMNRLRLPTGVYAMQVAMTAIKLSLITRCEPGDRNSTPVEPFDADAVTVVKKVKIPLTVIGRVQIEKTDHGPRLSLETILDSDLGACTFVFERADATRDQAIPEVVDSIKSALFQATNNLHDCIASSQWTMDRET